MNVEPYDVARMASLLMHLLMGFGTSTADAIRALQLAERMLRDADDYERGRKLNAGDHLAQAD